MHIPAKRGKPQHPEKVRDHTLSHLCWKSRCAFRGWKEAGRPRCGELYDDRRKCKADVRQYLNKKRGKIERNKIQKRDNMFNERHPHRFRASTVSKHIPDKLLVDNNLITDPSHVLSTWADHFESLGQSQVSSSSPLSEIQKRVNDMERRSFNDNDNVLDVPFDVEEVGHAVNRLKLRRSGGPDNLSPEHIRYCGPVCLNWLCKVYNSICDLEQIPDCFKHGIIVPAFKGKGKDPLLVNSYRGISLTSVFAKVLEILLLNRMNVLLDDSGVPQLTQTAYRRNVGCSDSIFASQEVNNKFIKEGDSVYTCYYDLEKAFDTVEFSVLLEQLAYIGIKGKCWRLIKNWHEDLHAQVKVGNLLSCHLQIGRGIRQGSVISPFLFNLVMDPLLAKLKTKNLGLSVQGLFLGAFAHADDIRTTSTNPQDTAEQVQYVTSFADRNGLKLSSEKCGIVITGRDGLDPPSSVAGLPVVESVKCLGVWWCSNSSSRKSIEERICKARRAFFANGDLGAFHGLLNPLSSRSLVESCVFPVLMYGAEAWSITASLLLKLESFQSEIGKKILRLPRFTANLVPLLALNWPTMRCRCLCAKLSFLHKIQSSKQCTLGTEVFNTLTFPSIESSLLINQCRLLEQPYSRKFTEEVLTNPDIFMRSLRKDIIKADRLLLLSEAKTHSSQLTVAEVASNMGWLKVWDAALDHGPSGTIAVLTILKLLCKTVFADRKCNVPECDFVIPPNTACCEHFLIQHTDMNIDTDSLLSLIYSCSEELFQTGLKLSYFL